MSRGIGYTKHLDLTQTKGVYERPVENWNFLYEASTTKNPQYDVGDRVCLPDGRVFRYGKAGSNLLGMKFGAKNGNILIAEKNALVDATAAGSMSVNLTMAASTYGHNSDGIIALDELKGGYISFYNSATVREQRGIIGNTAKAALGTTMTIYLDAPTVVDMSASTNCEILGNPYSNLIQENNGATCVMGMPNVLATSGQYFWIQTWGIFRVTPNAAELSTANDRQYCFDHAGSVVGWKSAHDSAEGGVFAGYQFAGFIVEKLTGVAGSAAPFINLQINP